MFTLASAAFAFSSDVAFMDDAQINHPLHISKYNKDAGTWTAGPNKFFDGKTYADVKGLMGTLFPTESELTSILETAKPQSHWDTIDDVPDSFDAREKWGKLVNPIRNQQRCGSCWAFSSAEVLSDRFSIKTGKSTILSPEDSVSCDKGDMGCNGGMLPAAWDYLTKTGIVTDTCFPYAAGNGTAPACPKSCADRENWESSKHKATGGYALKSNEEMQKEIMTNGPIQVAFKVYKSFMSYKSGVYKKHWNEFFPEGGHAVKIVGWGTEKGADYWLVANSWDTTWGDEGYFKIKRGNNECGIEKLGPPYAGLPSV
jgi:cathepsin B